MHIKRAINHGPNDKSNINSTISFSSKNSGSSGDSKWRRLYGEITLTGIETPDQNKRNFQWSVNEDGESSLYLIEKELYRIYETFENLLQYIVSLEQRSIEADQGGKEALKDIEEKAPEKIDVVDVSYDENKMSLIASTNEKFYKIFNLNKEDIGTINFLIKESSDIKEKIIDVKKENLNNVEITINQNHNLWKPFINNSDIKIRSEIIYPFLIAIALTDVIRDKSYISDVNQMEFIDVLNNILNKKWD